jgi:hypothetical protein
MNTPNRLDAVSSKSRLAGQNYPSTIGTAHSIQQSIITLLPKKLSWRLHERSYIADPILRRAAISHTDRPSFSALGTELFRCTIFLARCLRLLEFEFEVEYSTGKEHQGAATISRLQTNPEVQPPLDTEIPCTRVEEDDVSGLTSIEDLIEFQNMDPTCRQLCDSLVISSAVDYNSHGVIGNMLPSGEYQFVYHRRSRLPRFLSRKLPQSQI